MLINLHFDRSIGQSDLAQELMTLCKSQPQDATHQYRTVRYTNGSAATTVVGPSVIEVLDFFKLVKEKFGDELLSHTSRAIIDPDVALNIASFNDKYWTNTVLIDDFGGIKEVIGKSWAEVVSGFSDQRLANIAKKIFLSHDFLDKYRPSKSDFGCDIFRGCGWLKEENGLELPASISVMIEEIAKRPENAGYLFDMVDYSVRLQKSISMIGSS